MRPWQTLRLGLRVMQINEAIRELWQTWYEAVTNKDTSGVSMFWNHDEPSRLHPPTAYKQFVKIIWSSFELFELRLFVQGSPFEHASQRLVEDTVSAVQAPFT